MTNFRENFFFHKKGYSTFFGGRLVNVSTLNPPHLTSPQADNQEPQLVPEPDKDKWSEEPIRAQINYNELI